ncbi:Las1-like-domain-containing protein [Nemania sp. FL0916]|nr:Las1-like-domain-containing protein [Nemania sp. FL0916]
MVQYVHTPWRDQEELSRVRQQFYPRSSNPQLFTFAHVEPSGTKPTLASNRDEHDDATPATLASSLDAEEEQQQHQAVSRVSMWMQRGGCPHLVESTALLTAAVLSDLHQSRTRASSSSYAIRAAYSAAFSRFVTGLIDGQQDKLRKMSMYSIAKNIGLPATFVELRHQATHEQLPSLSKLRTAAQNALAWIWGFYWKDLIPVNKINDRENTQSNPQRDLLVRYLRVQKDGTQASSGIPPQLQSWDEALLLQTLADVGECSEEPQVILRALQMARTILGSDSEPPFSKTSGSSHISKTKDLDTIRVELQTLNEELESTRVEPIDQSSDQAGEASGPLVGWTRHQGIWTPKPIGVV